MSTNQDDLRRRLEQIDLRRRLERIEAERKAQEAPAPDQGPAPSLAPPAAATQRDTPAYPPRRPFQAPAPAAADATAVRNRVQQPPRPNPIVEGVRSIFHQPVQGRGLVDAAKAAARVIPRVAATAVENTGQFMQAMQGGAPSVDDAGITRPRRKPVVDLAPAGRAIEELGRTAREFYPATERTTQGEQEGHPIQPGNPFWWLERGGEAVAQLGGQIGLAMATGGAGPVASFLAFAGPVAVQEGGQAYADVKAAALARGVDPQKAHELAAGSAVTTALGNTVLEGLPAAQFVFRRIPGSEGVFSKIFAGELGRRIGAGISGFTVEGLEEASQTAWAAMVQHTMGEDPDAYHDLALQMTAAGVLGGLAGGLAGGVQGAPHGPQAPRGAPAAAPEAGTAQGAPDASRTLRSRLADMLDPSRKQELDEAYTDPMTGLANQTAFRRAQERLDADPETTMGVVDVQNLKGMNTYEGTAAADAELARLGKVLSIAALQNGVPVRNVFRAGGDEFAIAGTADQVKAALQTAEQLFGRRQIRNPENREIYAGIRTATGSTWNEANAAAEAKKATETGERFRGGDENSTPIEAPPEIPQTPPNEPNPPGAPEVRRQGAFYVNPAEELDVEPSRFQYKDVPDQEAGVGEELRRTRKWDPNFAGVVLAWRDPADGRLKVVNGHHRVDLAKRLGVEEVLVREIPAETAEQARAIGAMTNIAEGRGSPIDAAKIFRDSDMDAERLEEMGVSLKGEVAREGIALSKLAPGLFDLAARGKEPWRRLAVIGRSGLSHPQQEAVWEMVRSEEARGKRLTNETIGELARFVATSETEQVSQETLFGTETFDQSLALEKARLSSWVKEQLRGQARLFKFVSRGQRGEQLKRAGVGQVDTERAGELGTEAAQVAEVYDRLSTSAGPVSDVLNGAIRELRGGAKEADVRKGVLEAVRGAVQEVLGRGEQVDRPGGEGAAPTLLGDERTPYGAQSPYRGRRIYSRLDRAVAEAPQERMTPEQWAGYLDPQKRGFSAAEAAFRDLPSAIAAATVDGKVDRAKLQEQLGKRQLRIREKQLGKVDPLVTRLAGEAEQLRTEYGAASHLLQQAIRTTGYSRDYAEHVLTGTIPVDKIQAPTSAELEQEQQRTFANLATLMLNNFDAQRTGKLWFGEFDSRSEATEALSKSNPELEERILRRLDPRTQQGTFEDYIKARDALNAERAKPLPAEVARLQAKVIDVRDRLVEVSKQLTDARIASGDGAEYLMYSEPGGSNYREILIQLDTGPKGYQSPHWKDQDVLVHARVSDRTFENPETGKTEKVLFIEEIQSDWHQAGRDKGYRRVVEDTTGWTVEKPTLERKNWLVRDASGKEVGQAPAATEGEAIATVASGKSPHMVPDAPFKNTSEWVELALKPIIEEAVDGEYDRVALIDPQRAGERYNLRHQVETIELVPRTDGSFLLFAYDESGDQRIGETIQEAQLPDYVGRETARRLLEAKPEQLKARPTAQGDFEVISVETGEHVARYPTLEQAQSSMALGGTRRLTGEQLEVGGEGMAAFYAKIVPNSIESYLRTIGGPRRMNPVQLGLTGVDIKPVSKTNPTSRAGLGPEEPMWRVIYLDKSGGGRQDKIVHGDRAAAEAFAAKKARPDRAVLSFPVTPELRERVTTEGQRLMESSDLFGEAVDEPVKQGELLGGGPTGTTEAISNARAVVSSLEGRAARGALSSSDLRKFNEAKALVARLEGKGISAEEIQARSGARAAPAEPTDNLGLFDRPADLRRNANVTFGSIDETLSVNRETFRRSGDLVEVQLAGVASTAERIAAVKAGRELAYAWVPATGLQLERDGDGVKLEAVHQLLQGYRHPAAEYSHVLVIGEDGTVLHHRLQSAGWMSKANLSLVDVAEAGAIAKRLGGTVFLAHNHPSGQSSPSPEDMTAQRDAEAVLRRVGAKVGGHVVTNHNTATWFTYADNKSRELKLEGGGKDWTNPRAPRLLGPDEIARYLAALPQDAQRLDVLLMDARLQVVAFEAVGIERIDTVAEWLPALLREAAAEQLVLAVNGSDAYARAVDAVSGIPLPLLDIIEIQRRGSARANNDLHHIQQANLANPIFEERTPYGRREIDQTVRDLLGPPPSIGELRNAFSAEQGSAAAEETEAQAEAFGTEPGLPSGVALEAPTERLTAAVGDQTLYPVEPVELTKLAVELLGGERELVVKKFPWAYGIFYPNPKSPRIGINPILGKDYAHFARTLAHETGHLIDFLAESGRTMSRGNILGRIASLRRYLQDTIDALPTDPSNAINENDRQGLRAQAVKEAGKRPEDKAARKAWAKGVATRYAELMREEMEARNLIGREAVHEELRLLSEWWRPYDRENAPESYKKYRDSGVEIYADALSAFLNSPGSVQQRAPTFFDAFLAYSERKPEFADSYAAIQDAIGSGSETVLGARLEDLGSDFQRGEQIRREHEEKKSPQSVLSLLRQYLTNRGEPLITAEKKRIRSGKKKPVAHSAQNVMRMALQEWNHADTSNRLFLEDQARLVHDPLLEAGLTEDDASKYLTLTRIAEGDRGGSAEEAKRIIMEITGEPTWELAKPAYVQLLAEQAKGEGDEDAPEYDPGLLQLAETGILNPKGFTPETAKATLGEMERQLGADKYATLQRLMRKHRELAYQRVVMGVRAGVINSKVFVEKIQPNKNSYAPFAVLEYWDGRMSAGVKSQVGTLKSIAGPYTTSILKTMALNRMVERQKVTTELNRVLDTDFVGQAGPVQSIDRFHQQKPAPAGQDNLWWLIDGKPVYRAADAYLVRVLERTDLGGFTAIARTLSSATYGVFHPLYVSWSLAWQARNLTRDWKRTFKAMSTAHAGKPTYKQAIHTVLDVGRVNAAYARTMGAAWRNARRRPDALIREMLESRALGRAFHSFDPIGETTTERLLQRYGHQEGKPEGRMRQVMRAIGRPVETLGVFQETWAKAAAFDMLARQGITGKERAYIVRNYVGTPDSSEAGLASELVNGVFMYANVVMAGLRADAEVALQPQTASGYWFRSVLIDFLPKWIMAAAVAGWLGDELAEWFSRVQSYDLEKYIIVPLPPYEVTNSRGEKKSVYLRVPHDDSNRILAAATWALFMEDRPYAPSRTIGILAGEGPGLNPAFSLIAKNVQAAGNRNPYDEFRGREIVPTTAWEAGGWTRAKEMLRWDAQQWGILSQLAGYWTYQSPDESTEAPGEAFTRSIPGLSALVKISDRGLNEARYWEEDWETRERARLRSDLAPAVGQAVRDRTRLNRFGKEKITPQEASQRLWLNRWYTRVYSRETAVMELARDAAGGLDAPENRRRYDEAAARITASLERRR